MSTTSSVEMASAANDEQIRHQEILELLALFDPDCPQNFAAYEAAHGYSSVLATEPAPSTSNENQAGNENVNLDEEVASWMRSIDDEMLNHIDEIIAANEANRALASRSQNAFSDNDGTFSLPRKYNCPMCPKVFINKSAMEKHGRRHVLKQIMCPCGFRGQSPMQKHKHYLYHHVGMPKQKFLASF